MHAAHDVDDLRDVEVGGRRQVRVGEVLGHAVPGGEQVERRAHGLAHRLVEVRVEPRRHEVLAGPHEGTGDLAEGGESLVARHDLEAQCRAQGRLECRQRDLAIALCEVRVADIREGAGHLHGQVQDRPLDEQVDIDVAAVRPGRHRVRALRTRDGDAHRAEERRERKAHDALATLDERQASGAADHRCEDADVLGAARQCAGESALAVPVRDDAVRHARRESDDRDLEEVAGLGSLDEHRPGDHVRPVGDGITGGGCRDLDRVGEHRLGRDPVTREVVERILPLIRQDAFVTDRVERDGGPRRDGEHRGIRLARKPPPQHSLLRCGDVVVAGDGPDSGLQDLAHAVPLDRRRPAGGRLSHGASPAPPSLASYTLCPRSHVRRTRPVRTLPS